MPSFLDAPLDSLFGGSGPASPQGGSFLDMPLDQLLPEPKSPDDIIRDRRVPASERLSVAIESQRAAANKAVADFDREKYFDERLSGPVGKTLSAIPGFRAGYEALTPTPADYMAPGADPIYYAKKVPHLGSFLEAADQWDVNAAIERINAGTEDPSDFGRLANQALVAEKQQNWGMLRKIQDGLLSTGKVIGELATPVGGGAATTTGAVGKSLLGRAGGAALGVGKQAGMATVVDVGGLTAGTARRQQGGLGQEAMRVEEALPRALVDSFTQKAIEVGGGKIVGDGLAALIPSGVAGKVLAAVKSRLPNIPESKIGAALATVASRVGQVGGQTRRMTGNVVGGFGEEVLEERLGEVAGGVLGTPGQEDFGVTGKVAAGDLGGAAEDLLLESIIIGVLKAPAAAASLSRQSPEQVVAGATKRLGQRRQGVSDLISGTSYVPDWVSRSPQQAAALAQVETPSRSQWEAAGLPKGVSAGQRKEFADRVRSVLAPPATESGPQPDATADTTPVTPDTAAPVAAPGEVSVTPADEVETKDLRMKLKGRKADPRWDYSPAPPIDGDGVDSNDRFQQEIKALAETPPPADVSNDETIGDGSLDDSLTRSRRFKLPGRRGQVSETLPYDNRLQQEVAGKQPLATQDTQVMPAVDTDVLDTLASRHPEVAERLPKSAGVKEGYAVGEHTREVLKNLREQADPQEIGEIGQQLGVDAPRLLEYAVALHDIGKPDAIAAGDKRRQHEFTLPLLQKVLAAEGFTPKEVQIASTLIDNDVLGDVLKGRMKAKQAVGEINKLAAKAGLDPATYLKLQSLLYKSDAGSYPAVRAKVFKTLNGKLKTANVEYGILEEAIYGQVRDNPWIGGSGSPGGITERPGDGQVSRVPDGGYVHGTGIKFDEFDPKHDSGRNLVGPGAYLVAAGDRDVAEHYSDRAIKKMLQVFNPKYHAAIKEATPESIAPFLERGRRGLAAAEKKGDAVLAARFRRAVEVLELIEKGTLGRHVLPVEFKPQNTLILGASETGGTALSEDTKYRIVNALPAADYKQAMDKTRGHDFYNALRKQVGAVALNQAIRQAGYDSISFVHQPGGYKRSYEVMVALDQRSAKVGGGTEATNADGNVPEAASPKRLGTIRTRAVTPQALPETKKVKKLQRKSQVNLTGGGQADSVSEMKDTDVARILSEQFHNKEAGRTAEKLQDRWVSSRKFVRMEIPVDAATPATAIEPGRKSQSSGPIIVDENKTGAGRLQGAFGAPARILVLDGKHRLAEAIARGDRTIEAFVGENAVPKIEEMIAENASRQQEIDEATEKFLDPKNTSPGTYLSRLKRLLPEAEVDKLREQRKAAVAASQVNLTGGEKADSVKPMKADAQSVTAEGRMEGDKFAGMSEQELRDALQFYEDNIKTKESSRSKVPESWLESAAAIRAKLAGVDAKTEFVTDPQYYGHPQNAATKAEDYGLVPIKFDSRADLDRRIRDAAAIREKLQAKIGKAMSSKKKSIKSANDVDDDIMLEEIKKTEQYLYKLKEQQKKLSPVTSQPASPPGENVGTEVQSLPAKKGAASMSRKEWLAEDPTRSDESYDRAIWVAYFDGDITNEQAERLVIRNSMGNKELWAQTRDEIAAKGKLNVKAAKAERAAGNKLKGTKEYANWRIRANNTKAREDVEYTKKYNEGLLAVHKERVQEALAEGKPVPPEVLADYPDLQPASPPGENVGTPIGRSWDSPRGKKTVVAERKMKDGRTLYEVAEGDDPASKTGNELHSLEDLDVLQARDEKLHEAWLADEPKRQAAAKREQDAADRKAAEEAARKDLKGFTDGKTSIAKGRIEKTLDAQSSLDGKLTTRREKIEKLVAGGAVVKVEDFTDGTGRKQTERRLYDNADSDIYRDEKGLTKTGMDYAEYLIAKRDAEPSPRAAADAAEAENVAEQERNPQTAGLFGAARVARRRSDAIGKTPELILPENPKFAAALERSFGVKPESIFQKAKSFVAENMYKLGRSNTFIPQVSKRWAKVREMFRLAKQIPQNAQDEAVRNLHAIVDDLGGPNQYKLFSYKAVVDNLAAAIERGDPLRFRVNNLQEVLDYKAKLDKLADETPAVKKAFEKRQQIVTDLVDELVGLGLLDESAKEKSLTYYHQQVMFYVDKELKGSPIGRSGQMTKRGFQKARVNREGIKEFGEELDYNTSYLEAEFAWMRDAYAQIGLEKWIRQLKKMEDKTKEFKAFAKDLGKDWRQVVNENDEYAIWEAEPGNLFYSAYGVPERVVEELLASNDQMVMLAADDVRKHLVMGGKRREMVLPVEIVNELDRMKKRSHEWAVAKISRKASGLWEMYTLLSPKNLPAYTGRNFLGDTSWLAEAAMGALAPKYSQRALNDMMSYFGVGKNKKVDLPYDMQAARDLAVIDASFSATLEGIKDVPGFRRFFEGNGSKLTVPFELISQYFDNAAEFSRFRESFARYAAFLYYRDKLKDGKLYHYGGARKATIDALAAEPEFMGYTGLDVAAAKLSRSLLGDYGDMTVFGDTMRKHFMSFYAFTEVLHKRYPNVIYNAGMSGFREYGASGKGAAGSARAIGRAGAGAAVTTAKVGASVAIKAGVAGTIATAAISVPYYLMQAYNNLFWPDEEEELTQEEQASPHLIMGRNPDGSIRILRNTAPLGEWLEWFGVGVLFRNFEKIERGQMTPDEAIAEAGKSVMNKVAASIKPTIKAPIEIVTGSVTYPDITNPRRKPRDEIAASYIDMEDELKAAKGVMFEEGDRSRPNYIARHLIGVTDPRKSAYYEITELRDKFLEKEGTGSFRKNRFMKNMQEAASNGDEVAFQEARTAYIKDGGDFTKFKRTLGMLDPLKRMADDKEADFEQNYLSASQREKLQVAREYAAMLNVEMWRMWKEGESTDSPEVQEKLKPQKLEEVKSLARDLLTGLDYDGEAKEVKLTATEEKKGLRLAEKRRQQEAARKEARRALRNSPLPRREVMQAVEEWISSDVTDEKRREAKLEMFKEQVGW